MSGTPRWIKVILVIMMTTTVASFTAMTMIVLGTVNIHKLHLPIRGKGEVTNVIVLNKMWFTFDENQTVIQANFNLTNQGTEMYQFSIDVQLQNIALVTIASGLRMGMVIDGGVTINNLFIDITWEDGYDMSDWTDWNYNIIPEVS